MSRADLMNDQAAAWIIAREDGDWSSANQTAFDAWLSKSDANRAAYWRLKHSWHEAGRIGALRESADRIDVPVATRPATHWRIPAAVAASLIMLAATSTTMVSWRLSDSAPPLATTAYDTPVGGRKLIRLADGSSVQLNTTSRLRTAMASDRREVWLDKGEAYFEVAHMPGRPFVVHAGIRQITVLGTKFSVRRDRHDVIVAVLEGRVRVDEIGAANDVPPAIIATGDIALARGEATLVTAESPERVADALAWRSGTLSFDQTSLSDVAAEFNRYNRVAIAIADPEVGAVRIGGVFPASKPRAFAGLLRDAYGLKVVETAEAIKISK